MKKIILILIFFFMFISCTNDGLIYENAFVIENINLIDPIHGLEENMSVVVSGNKILEIYKTRDIKLSAKNKI